MLAEAAITSPVLILEEHFLKHQVDIEAWFRAQWLKTQPSFYGSIDLRNAGYKLAPVDTNLFPAGFNNLNPDFMPLCVQAVQATMAEICPDAVRLLIIPESHSRNVFYFESLAMLKDILINAGFDVRIGTLDAEINKPQAHTLPSGRSIVLEPLVRQGQSVGVDDFFPCCIVLNNDLSSGIPSILENLDQRLMPSAKLGWATRLKSEHFRYYRDVCNEFSKVIEIDPWLISPLFDQCPEVNFLNQEGQNCLVSRAEILFEKIKKKYQEYNIDNEPFLVVKADQGTYGMAVMMIQNPQQLRTLNRKQRTRMSMSKGGVQVTKAIVQEGVYSFEMHNKAVAEPVVYLIGRHVVGGFYRVHENRGPNENLNAPGMNFHPLAFEQSCQTPCIGAKPLGNRFYVYGIVARLAILAAARELAAFKGEPRD